MNKDIIYRDEAIDAIHGYWKGELSKMPTTDSEYGEVIDGDCDTLLRHNKELSTRIEDIPSADRPQEWIPCKERLPKEAEPILVTINGKTYFAPFGINEESSKELGTVAWMPLPEPWKGADDE